MIRRKSLALALLTAVGSVGSVGAPAQAAPLTFEGLLDLRAGYGNNPYFRQNNPGGSPLLGATLSGTLSKATARSKTSLFATGDLEQNLQHYGRTENLLTQLSHVQQFSATLTGNADVSYQNAINPRNTPDDLISGIDLLTVGQRSRRLAGDAGLQWQPTARDGFQIGVNGSHNTYSGFASSAYDQYGASGSYLRTLNARTKVGVQVAAVAVDSRRYPDSKSVQIGLQLVQQLSAIWLFNGSVGVILQKTDGIGASSKQTLGFNGSLCGKYPRYTICITAARQSAPSGLGGLRTDLQGAIQVDYTISARSRAHFDAAIDSSKSESGLLPRQRYYSAAGSYSHDISRRLAAGFSGRYQKRDFGSLLGGGNSTLDSYSITADLIVKLGRVGA